MSELYRGTAALAGIGLLFALAAGTGCQAGSGGGEGADGAATGQSRGLPALKMPSWGRVGATGAGAAAGAAVGAQVGEGKNRTAAMVAGGLVGGWVGNALYERLTAQDREGLTKTTEQTVRTGQPHTYKNPESGVQVQTQVAQQEQKTETVALPVLKERVEQVPPLELIGETYTAKTAAEIRSGPGDEYKVVARCVPGQTVHVVGKVQDQPWLMIGEGGAGSGFAAESGLAPVPGGSAGMAPPAAAAAPATPAAGAGAGTVTTAQVPVEREYRTVEQKVTLSDGTVHTEQVTVREGPNGWEIQ